MLDFLPAWLKGTLAVLLILTSTLFWYPLLLLLSLLKLLIPITPVRKLCTRGLNWIATIWIHFNGLIMRLLNRIEWRVEGLEQLERNQWYFVTSNHQSWADITALQYVLNGRIPLMKFFLKQELIWVPLLGIAWWALDFPFMKRHSRAQIKRRPELAERDVQATRAACARFRQLPVAVVNFVEGTRFRPSRHAAQKSPYRHLLKPRAGGVAFTLDAMGEVIDRLIDVTIVYPQGRPRMVDMFANRVREIRVVVHSRPIPDWLRSGDYLNDENFRMRIRGWVNELWQLKDETVTELNEHAPDSERAS